MSDTKKPELRFEGFNDDWEQRKFSTFVQRESVFRESSSECPGVEYEDVIAEEGRLNKNVRQKETHKTGIVFDGTQVLYGKLRPYLHNWLSPDFTGVAVGDWWVLRPVGVDKKFLYRLLQTQQFDDVANQSSGSKMPRADWNLVSNTDFIIPSSVDEQRQIAETFDDLDNLITLHQRKYEKLLVIKKSMLGKMFPKAGEKVPEIRFAGFTDDWEQRKLGEMGSTFTGLSGKTKDDFGHGEAQFVTYMNVYTNPVADLNMTEKVEVDPRQQSVKYGDIFFTTSSETPDEVGMSSVWLGDAGNTYLNSFCFGYRPEKKIDPYYMAFMLRSAAVRKKLIYLAQGISRYNISKNRAMNIEILLPGLDEQKKIGEYFKSLDHLITLHQREVNKLKNLKKSLLGKMFI